MHVIWKQIRVVGGWFNTNVFFIYVYINVPGSDGKLWAKDAPPNPALQNSDKVRQEYIYCWVKFSAVSFFPESWF